MGIFTANGPGRACGGEFLDLADGEFRRHRFETGLDFRRAGLREGGDSFARLVSRSRQLPAERVPQSQS